MISIHALLAESDSADYSCHNVRPISIHALLAESDSEDRQRAKHHTEFLSTLSLRRATKSIINSIMQRNNFYPRSPCGERQLTMIFGKKGSDFYPRSPCGERRAGKLNNTRTLHFYPRSPCGERRKIGTEFAYVKDISIHALLAESDCCSFRYSASRRHFYPRSPCGERLGRAVWPGLSL